MRTPIKLAKQNRRKSNKLIKRTPLGSNKLKAEFVIHLRSLQSGILLAEITSSRTQITRSNDRSNVKHKAERERKSLFTLLFFPSFSFSKSPTLRSPEYAALCAQGSTSAAAAVHRVSTRVYRGEQGGE